MVTRDIGKSYAGRRAVTGFNLTIYPGEVIGFIGANGGGKTTTLQMLAGVLAPDEGVLEAGDVPLTPASIGFVPQRQSLYLDLSICENLYFRAQIYRLNPAARAVQTMIDTYGLSTYANHRISQLSGGWARRAQFAASMIHAPRFVLLDEPTVGLDAPTRQFIWEQVESLAANGTAIVLSSHDLADASRCHRIVYFSDGRVTTAQAPASFIAEADLRAWSLATADPPLVTQLRRNPVLLNVRIDNGAIRLIAYRKNTAEVETLLGGDRLEGAPVTLEDAFLVRTRTETLA